MSSKSVSVIARGNGKSSVTVNGKTYSVSGTSVSVQGEDIYVDGKFYSKIEDMNRK